MNARPTPRFGLRILPGYPVDSYVGDVIVYGNSTRAQVEKIRADMHATGRWHEVVELDADGGVVEQHRLVTVNEFGNIPHHTCTDCGASRHGIHPPPPPCPGAAS